MLSYDKRFTRVLLAASVLTGTLTPISAKALIVLQQARLPASIEYDSNPTMSDKNKQSVWRYTLNPTYKITGTNGLSSWFLDAGLRFQRSSDRNISIDREDPSVGIGWEREFDRGKLSAIANYAETSTRFSEFEAGTGIVQKDGTSTTKSLSINGSRLLTERLSGSAGMSYRKIDYSGTPLNNYSSKGVNFGLTYLYNEKLSPFLQLGLSDYNPSNPNANGNTSRSITLGTSYLISPQLSSNFGVGINRVSSNGSAWIGNAGLTYDGNRHHYLLTYARSVNATGLGGFQESDRIGLNYIFDLTNTSRLGADYSLIKNKSINNNETERLSGWYSRQLTQFWDFKFTLDHKKLKGAGKSVDADIAGITLSYQWPQF